MNCFEKVDIFILQSALDTDFSLILEFNVSKNLLSTINPSHHHKIHPSQNDNSSLLLSISTRNMDKIRVDGFNGLRFTPIRKSKGCFTGTSYTCGSTLNQNPKSGINPNKAVFTIDAKTSNILIVNKNACESCLVFIMLDS